MVHHGRSITYAQLDRLARGVAKDLGPRPGPVGVRVAHRPSTVVHLLGVWMAAGIYCPVDPTFPAERRRLMADAIGWRTTLDGTGHIEAASGSDTPPGSNTAVDVPVGVAPDDPAYALFTSGSTGSPKAVYTSRGAISVAATALRDRFEVTSADRVLQFASLNWDTCFEEIVPALLAGATIVFDDEAHTGSMPRFLRMLQQQEISILDLPTAFWHELVYHLAEDDIGLPDPVRLLIIGGEAVNPTRLREWADLKTSHVRLLNTYGCTETTLVTHAIDLHGPAADREANGDNADGVPIGTALPHVYEHISSDGELLISGPGVALGYSGSPESTTDRFVTIDGRRYFRTGDRVAREPDGVLIHRGRLDHEVKIRGIRVDPGEVEARVLEHHWVAAVAVVGVSLAGRTALVAYVVPEASANSPALAAELADFLRSRVPVHLVPSQITVVPELAYTASGKVDRAATHRRFAARKQV